MAGVVVFRTIAEALRAGFVIVDRDDEGYIVRREGPNGWERARVDIRND